MTDEEIYEQLLEFVSSRGLFSTLGSGKGFVSYFVDQYLTKEALEMLGDTITDAALGSIAPLWSVQYVSSQS